MGQAILYTIHTSRWANTKKAWGDDIAHAMYGLLQANETVVPITDVTTAPDASCALAQVPAAAFGSGSHISHDRSDINK